MRIEVTKQALELIESGEKTVEAKVHIKRYSQLATGDRVTFCHKGRKITCEITSKTLYSSFREMLLTEGFSNCTPKAKDLKESIRTFERIPRYKALVQPHGVFAIRIKTIAMQSRSL